jgi:hypothetical protein
MSIEIAPLDTIVQLNYDAAKLYCWSLVIDDKRGWRLPTINEISASMQIPSDALYWVYDDANDSKQALAALPQVSYRIKGMFNTADINSVIAVREVR